MLAFSTDLKWRIVYLYYDGYSKKKIAQTLYMSEYTVKKVLRNYRKWGCVIDPWLKKAGRCKTFNGDDMKALRQLVADKVDWYLDELVSEMEVLTRKKVSVPTLWRSLRFCGITRKKLHKCAKERNEILRGAFIANIGTNYTPDQLVFLDESAKDERSLSRGYGYSLMNTRARKNVTFVRGKRYTILPALSLQGFIAIDIMEGSCTKERFKNFVISDVLPKMNPYPGPNSVIILDNAKIHHNEDLIDYLQAFGIHVEFLPPYSPDLNPIESAFSVMKSFLKKNRDFIESCSDSIYALFIASLHITPAMAEGFFRGTVYL